MLPNSDWDCVRDHLTNRVEKKVCGMKRKSGQMGVAICSQIAKRKIAKKNVKAEDVLLDEEMNEDERLIPQKEMVEIKAQNVMAMRKSAQNCRQKGEAK